MTPEDRAKLLEKAKLDSAKAKAEEDRRVNEQANRLDHITRYHHYFYLIIIIIIII